MNSITEITKRLIAFKTISTDHKVLRESLEFVSSILNPSIQVKIFDNHGSPLLWATTKSFSKPDVLLLCHIDVVQAKDQDFTPVVSKGKIFGRGAFDMKGNLASMITTLNTVDSDSNIHLVITSDEEIGGKNGSRWFFNKFKVVPKITIVPDGTSLFEVVTRQKGPIHLLVQVEGRAAHGSRPWEGDNPISKLLSVIEDLSHIETATSNNDWLPTITTTNIQATSSINQVPQSATMTLDLRLTDKKQLAQIKMILSNHGAKITQTFGDGIVLYQPDSRILKKWKTTVERITNKTVTNTTMTGASDARHVPVASQLIVTRGVGGNAHMPNEWVDIKSLHQLSAITKLFIKELKS